VRRDLGGQGPEHRRLPGVRRPGDHDVLPRGDRRAQERGQLLGERPGADQVVEGDRPEAGPADRQRRALADPHDRGEAGAVGQPQVELGVGGVERPGGEADVGGEDLDELDELLVGVGDRRGGLLAAVGVADEHPVAAVDVDVLDLGVLQQRLQAADAEQGGVDRRGDPLLLLGRRRHPPLGDLGGGVVLEDLDDERAGVVPLVLAGHRRAPGDLVTAPLLVQPVGHLGAQPANELVGRGQLGGAGVGGQLLGAGAHRNNLLRWRRGRRRTGSSSPSRVPSAGVPFWWAWSPAGWVSACSTAPGPAPFRAAGSGVGCVTSYGSSGGARAGPAAASSRSTRVWPERTIMLRSGRNTGSPWNIRTALGSRATWPRSSTSGTSAATVWMALAASPWCWTSSTQTRPSRGASAPSGANVSWSSDSRWRM